MSKGWFLEHLTQGRQSSLSSPTLVTPQHEAIAVVGCLASSFLNFELQPHLESCDSMCGDYDNFDNIKRFVNAQ